MRRIDGIDRDALIENLGIAKDCNECKHNEPPYCRWKPDAVDICEAICGAPSGVSDIGEVSDGFHTFNDLYEQRMILFAALVKVYKDRAWKSLRHEDGELCFGGGWFIVGIDTPKGSYTYHYENKYFDLFDCEILDYGKHWDGHTEEDAEERLMSLEPEKRGRWIERNPQNSETCRLIECSECGKGYIVGYNVPYEDWTEAHAYCVKCGSHNGGKQLEDE